MKTALIIHGCSDKKEYDDNKDAPFFYSPWLRWLQKQLSANNISAQAPEMPVPYKPNYYDWKNTIEQFDINENTILIGHSCGGGFLLRWPSESKRIINKLVLVAPYLDPNNNRGDFLKFNIDPTLSDRIKSIHILLSNDEESIKTSVKRIMKELPNAKLHEIPNMGHFCLDQMGTDKFPELLDIILH